MGHREDYPIYRVRNLLRAGADRLNANQWDCLDRYLAAGDPDHEA